MRDVELRTIFRIESPSGEGMYRGDDVAITANSILSFESHIHKLPWSDDLLTMNVGGWDNFSIHPFSFGFDSIEQLRRWVYEDDWLIQLHIYGFVMGEYLVPKYGSYVGDSQAIFDKNRVRNRHQHSIADYFALNVGEYEIRAEIEKQAEDELREQSRLEEKARYEAIIAANRIEMQKLLLLNGDVNKMYPNKIVKNREFGSFSNIRGTLICDSMVMFTDTDGIYNVKEETKAEKAKSKSARSKWDSSYFSLQAMRDPRSKGWKESKTRQTKNTNR